MRMTPFTRALMAGTALILIAGCGGGSEDTATISTAADSPSPMDAPFTYREGEPIDVATALEAAGLGGTISYASANFDDELGATVLTDVRAGDDEASVTIARAELFGVDTDTLMTVRQGAAMEDMAPLFRKIRLYDVDANFPIEQEGGAVGRGTFTAGGVDIDTLSVKSPGERGYEGLSDRQASALGLQSLEFGGMALKTAVIDVPTGATDEDRAKIEVADGRLGAYRQGAFDGMLAKNISFEMKQDVDAIQESLSALGTDTSFLSNNLLQQLAFPRQQSGTVGEFSWDGFSVANLLPYLERDETPPLDAKNLISVGGMEMIDQVGYREGRKVSTTEKVTLSPIEFDHLMPKSFKMTSEGAVTDATAFFGDANPEITEILMNNGLDEIEGNATIVYDYEPKQGRINLNMETDANGLYETDFNLSLSDFDYPALISGDEAAIEAAQGQLSLANVTMRLEDDKLLDTLFAAIGVEQDRDPAVIRQQLSGLITFGALQGARFSPRVPDYAAALSSFINEGGTLTISATPDAPVSFQSLTAVTEENPASVLDTLDLTVTKN